MEYREKAFVDGYLDRKHVFPEVRWLSKARFEELLQKGASIQPYLDSSGGGEGDTAESRVYIGKSIPKRPPDTHENNGNTLGDIQLAGSYHYIELLGNVLLREDYIDEDVGDGLRRRRRKSVWVLRVTHNGHARDIDDDFVVLHVDDPAAYFWSPSYESNVFNGYVMTFQRATVPAFAYRAAFDRVDHKYNYVGRVITVPSLQDHNNNHIVSNKRLKFFANAWIRFDDDTLKNGLRQSFGRIGRSQRLLYVPYCNIEVGLDCFETLCLKPSPASLKSLCQSAIRSYLNHNQANIQKLETSIPKTLADFIKYPIDLKLGDFLFRSSGDKIVSDDGEYEIYIDDQSRDLILKQNNRNNNSSDSMEVDTNDHKQTIVDRNCDAICLHRFYLVFYDLINSRVTYAYPWYDPSRFYRFTGEWHNLTWKVK